MEAEESTFSVSQADAEALKGFIGRTVYKQPTVDIAGQEVILRGVTSGRDKSTLYFAFEAPGKVVSFMFDTKTSQVIDPINCDEAFVADFCEATRRDVLTD